MAADRTSGTVESTSDSLDEAQAAWRDRVFKILGWSRGGAALFDPPGEPDAEAVRRDLTQVLLAGAQQSRAWMPAAMVKAHVTEAQQALAEGDFVKVAALIALLGEDDPDSGVPPDHRRLAEIWRNARKSTETVIAAVHRAALADHPELAKHLAVMDRAPVLFAAGLEDLLDRAGVARGEAQRGLAQQALVLAEAYDAGLEGNGFLLHLQRNPYIPMDAIGFLRGRLGVIVGALRS